MNKDINLNLGSGVGLLPGFINVDNTFSLEQLKTKKGLFQNAKLPKRAEFVQADMRALPFKDNFADYIECINAIEHLPFGGVETAISEMLRVLKPGGKAIIFTHDFDDMARMWTEFIEGMKPFNSEKYFTMVQAFYGNQISEGEFHRSMFNPTYANGLMHSLGFTDVKIFAYPRGVRPPKLKGHKFPEDALFLTGMLLIEGVKPVDKLGITSV